MAGFLQRFYAKVYVNITLEPNYCDVYVSIEKRGTLLEENKKRFTTSNSQLTPEIITYIEQFERRSPFSYISVLMSDVHQGAKMECSIEHMSDKIMLCANDKRSPWSVYADAIAISVIQKKFKQCGLDYIFSPFLLIPHCFKEIETAKAQMFILSLENSLTISVFQKGQLIFGQQVSLHVQDDFYSDDFEEELLLDSHDDHDVHDLDLDMEINVDDDIEGLERLDVLDDLDDLDNLDELDHMDGGDGLQSLDEINALDSFDDSEHEATLKEVEKELIQENKDLGGFTKNFKRYELISKSIQAFYAQEEIAVSFIENIFIASSLSDHQDLKGYLKDELFVEVILREIDIDKEFLRFVKKEVKYGS